MKHKRIFLDFASATPLSKKVFKKMKPFLSSENFANPSALYFEALENKKHLENTRQKIAKICGVKKHEVIFTSGGTESINLALLGLFLKNKNQELITSKLEHPATIETAKKIESQGHKVSFLKVDHLGRIDLNVFKQMLNQEVLLVSLLYVNNEIGNINPIKKISSEIKKYKNKIGRNSNQPPYLHIDASQAPNFLEINLDKLGCDMLTLDSSKIYGPKGVGALIKKDHIKIEPILFGGNQEFGLRAGTENLANIVGFGYALEQAQSSHSKNFQKIYKLQKYFIEKLENKIFSKIEGAKINGDLENRIPNNINICIPKLNAEFAVIQLDQKGLSCSSVTACRSINSDSRSYVIDELNSNCGASSLRFTMGLNTTQKDIDITISILEKVLL